MRFQTEALSRKGIPRLQEVRMTELSGARIITEQAAADATARVAKANREAMNFLFGAQRLVLDELVFAGNELLERANGDALVHRIRRKSGGSPFREGHQGDVRGMRPASDRFYPARQRSAVQSRSADDRYRIQTVQSAVRGLIVFRMLQN